MMEKAYCSAKAMSFLSCAGVVLKDGDVISADFVVDASGRNSKLSEWLEASGHSAPPQEVINSGLGYGTRTYQIPEDWYQKHVRPAACW
jgi:flavin-dependent dehydrogenase